MKKEKLRFWRCVDNLVRKWQAELRRYDADHDALTP